MSLAAQTLYEVPVGVPTRVPVPPECPYEGRLAPVVELHRPADTDVAAPLRLTRRGVVFLTLVVALLGAGVVLLGRLSAPSAAPPRALHGAVTVQAGDTLWSIAARVAPQRDPRAEVEALQQHNHLTSLALVPGQVLHVP